MVELSEESLIFLRVTPGHYESALTELEEHPKVKSVEPVFGVYDLAVTGAFKSMEELRKFQSEIDGKEFTEDCTAYPGFENWHREEEFEEPFESWTLIKALDTERAIEALQKVPSVQQIIGTLGEFNVIARVGAKDPKALQKTLVDDIQKIRGVQRTETRPTLMK